MIECPKEYRRNRTTEAVEFFKCAVATAAIIATMFFLLFFL